MSDYEDEVPRINGEEGGREVLLPSLLVVAPGGGDDNEEDDEFEDEVNLFERLLSFFFSPSSTLSSILWCRTFVEFKLTGIIQLQKKPTINPIITNLIQ